MFNGSYHPMLTELKYEYDESRHFFQFNMTIEGFVSQVTFIVTFEEWILMTYVDFPIRSTKEAMNETIRIISWINNKIRFGCIEMDLSDGEVKFRFPRILIGIDSLSEDAIAETIRLPLLTLIRYTDSLARVMIGAIPADTEISSLEKQ